ncbi:progesterone-induced-blocking factor 1 [Pelomyxa schiedti]|nr:progesterone-induced-blocking factor 1 [Pelomyxa schiedti]
MKQATPFRSSAGDTDDEDGEPPTATATITPEPRRRTPAESSYHDHHPVAATTKPRLLRRPPPGESTTTSAPEQRRADPRHHHHQHRQPQEQTIEKSAEASGGATARARGRGRGRGGGGSRQHPRRGGGPAAATNTGTSTIATSPVYVTAVGGVAALTSTGRRAMHQNHSGIVGAVSEEREREADDVAGDSDNDPGRGGDYGCGGGGGDQRGDDDEDINGCCLATTNTSTSFQQGSTGASLGLSDGNGNGNGDGNVGEGTGRGYSYLGSIHAFSRDSAQLDATSTGGTLMTESYTDLTSDYSDDESYSFVSTESQIVPPTLGNIVKLKRQISHWKHQVARLEREKHLIEMQSQSELNELHEQFVAEQEQFSLQVEELQEKQKRLEQEHPLLSERLQTLRESLADVTTICISDERAQALKVVPEEQLPLTDLIALKIYNIVAPARRQTNQLKRENDALSGQVRQLSSDMKTEQTQLESALATTKDDLNRCTVERDVLKERNSHLLADLRERDSTVASLQTDSEKFKAVSGDLAQCKTELQEALRRVRAFEIENESIKSSKCSYIFPPYSLLKRAEMLTLDKDFLTKQVEESNAKIEQLEEALARKRVRAASLKQRNDDLAHQVHALQDAPRQQYERRLHEEIDLIQKKMISDVTEMRAQSQHSLELQTTALREARDSAIAEGKRLKLEVESWREKYEHSNNTHSQLTSSLELRLSEALNTAKVKQFELDRVMLQYTAAQSESARAGIECEKYRKKLDLLTSEYRSLQASYDNQVHDLMSQLQQRESRINQLQDDSGYFAGNLGTAQTLTKKIADLEKSLTEQKNMLDSTAAQLVQANSSLSLVQQPQKFLIDKVRQHETTASQQAHELQSLRQKLSQSEAECNRLIQRNAALEQKVLKVATLKEKVLTSLSQQQQQQQQSFTVTTRRNNINPANNTAALAQSVISQSSPPSLTNTSTPPAWSTKLSQKLQLQTQSKPTTIPSSCTSYHQPTTNHTNSH